LSFTLLTLNCSSLRELQFRERRINDKTMMSNRFMVKVKVES